MVFGGQLANVTYLQTAYMVLRGSLSRFNCFGYISPSLLLKRVYFTYNKQVGGSGTPTVDGELR